MCNIGILTFHCADNFGAMLQAYGLKQYLVSKKMDVEIVRYEPPFMTGRHWWIPYIPKDGLRSILDSAQRGWRSNLSWGKNFFIKRKNMRCFRKKYLTSSSRKKFFFSVQMRRLPYQYYVVGSDQIWNPDITLGLKKVYFGNFRSNRKKKVIAYAASLGKESLESKYDEEFSELLQSVDCVSVRESVSIPYIRQFYGDEILAVPDPVFLLQNEQWKKIEKVPDRDRYIFVYMTEKNKQLIEYVKELAKRKQLLIVKIEGWKDLVGENIIADDTAGPSELLGYIHKADYVITNSFHGVAFSIIYHKQFLAFQHSSANARISNILQLCGLESRLYRDDRDFEIDLEIEWIDVKKCIEDQIKVADKYLVENLDF